MRLIFVDKQYFTKRIASISFFIAIAFISCASGNGDNTSPVHTDSQTVVTPTYDNSLAKGKVTDTIICQADRQTFALYLPSYYRTDKLFPCIYFYDAHARGSVPVRMYAGLAEKYGFVLIGSNLSKNGISWETINGFVKTLMTDTRNRIHIDPQRIYTAGFSGGSRVASSIAIFDGGIAGVIGCAAGFPQTEQTHKFDYFGLVGTRDFNLGEMVQLDANLQEGGFTHQLVIYNGIHGWPPATEFETALLWLQVNAMKAHLQEKNDTIINSVEKDFNNRITNSGKDLSQQHRLLEGLDQILDGLRDVTTYKKSLVTLTAGEPYKEAIVLEQQLQQKEMNLQQQLSQLFGSQAQKCSTEIADLNRNIRNAKTEQESQMYQRVLSYNGLLSYMYADRALKANDMTNADVYLKLFVLADPKNPDCAYLRAIYYVKSNNSPMAIRSLMTAAKMGYNDVGQLQAEPAFVNLHNNADFEAVLLKTMENYKSGT